MSNEIPCKLCNRTVLTTYQPYFFDHQYRGFSLPMSCLVKSCFHCDGVDAEQLNDVVETAKYEMDLSLDKLILKFYLYSDCHINKLFKHYKKGTIYKLISIANLETTDQTKFPTMAVYVDIETELVWARPLEEFIKNFTIQG